MASAILSMNAVGRRWRSLAAGIAIVGGSIMLAPFAAAQDAAPLPGDPAAGAPVVPLPQQPAAPQEPVRVFGEDPDAVVAIVNGEAITERDLVVMANLVGEVLNQFPQQAWRELLIDTAIEFRVASQAAVEMDLDETQAFIQNMADFRQQALRQQYINDVVVQMVTDEDVRAAYDEAVAAMDLPVEVTVRVIMVASEAEANDIIRRLNEGEQFADLAMELSLDRQTAEAGGQLPGGYYTEEAIVQEFADVVFNIEPGSVHQVPVLFQDFWHVVQVDDRRQQPPPTFESMEENIRQQLISEAYSTTIDTLREEAEVEIVAAQPAIAGEEAPADDAAPAEEEAPAGEEATPEAAPAEDAAPAEEAAPANGGGARIPGLTPAVGADAPAEDAPEAAPADAEPAGAEAPAAGG